MQGEFPVSIVVAQQVTNGTCFFGSKTSPGGTIVHANASPDSRRADDDLPPRALDVEGQQLGLEART